MTAWISKRLGRTTVAGIGPTDNPTQPDEAVMPSPSSLYLFGPSSSLAVGMRVDCPDRPPEDGGPRQFADQPSFFGWWATVGDPSGHRIWRLTPDDPTTIRPGRHPGFWLCRSATVVEELSPTMLMPAWDDVVALCGRLRDLPDAEAVRIAGTLPEPDWTWVSGRGSMARHWVSWSVGHAARAADSPSRPVMRSVRAMGSWYEDIIDPAWKRIEVAADVLADGLADGTATLELEGSAFGPWPSRPPEVSGPVSGHTPDTA